MDLKNIQHQYHRLKQDLNQFENKLESSDELARMIFCSDWIRIFFTGDTSTKQIAIQVEVITAKIPGLKDSTKIQPVLETYIHHLQHLLHLFDKGFTLDFIVEEGLWFAVKNIYEEPSQQFIEELFHSEYQILECD
jgi:hypothetical protein